MNSEKSGFFDGLLFGGLLGAALGVVFAPAAGEETRDKIKKKLSALELDDIVDKFSEAFEAGKVEAEKTLKELGE